MLKKELLAHLSALEGCFVTCLVLAPPPQEHTLYKVVLAAYSLGWTPLAGCDLPAALKLELAGVSPQSLLLRTWGVTLHPISSVEVD